MNTVEQRRLNWPGCLNIRDLGGYATRDGVETTWRAVLRADSLGRLQDQGVRDLIDFGVTTIIDLRGPDELNDSVHPFADHRHNGTVRYLLLPVIDDDDTAVMDKVHATDSTARVYCLLLEGFSGRFSGVLRAILDAPAGVVLFHCHAGKDRTGIVAALLLDLAGVPPQTIVADYALTDPYIDLIYQESMLTAPVEPEAREKYRARLNAKPEKMAGFMEFLDQRYGGTVGFLREAGWSDEDIAGLRARVVRSDSIPGE